MTATTMIFVLLGAGFVAGNVTRALLWLDTPRPRRRARYAR